MARTAGSYSPEAIGETGAKGRLMVKEKSPKAAMWGIFAFHLFRGALFFGAAYNSYAHNSGTAWLLGIVFVYSFLDPQSFMKPNLMSAYLAFTVIFYYHRWVMGWGNPATTIYSEDAPTWVKVFKDIVWIGFFSVFAFKALTRPRVDRNMPLWFTPRGMGMVFLTAIYFLLPTLSLIYARGKMSEIILLDMRYPLEYVPVVILLPFVLQGGSSVKYLRTFIPLILLSLVSLGVEMFSGRPTGFGGLGLYVRYGSIFGSPNDFGAFLMLCITGILAFVAERAIKLSLRLAVLVGLCLGALASTISLSSIFAMVFTTVNLVLFARNKVKSGLTGLAVVVLAATLYFAFPDTGVATFLRSRLENLSSLEDASSYQHYTNVVIAEDAIKRFEPAEYLVGTFQSRKDLLLPETYYLRTFYVRGGVSLLLLLSIISLTLFEANHRYRAVRGNPEKRGLFLTTFLGVAGITFACLFIPYLETFPTNFYFWFLVAIIWGEPMTEKEIAEFRAFRPRQQVTGGGTQLVAPRLGG